MAQVEMQEWWRRHENLDLDGYSREEIEDLTGCVPLFLSEISVGGTKIDMEAPMLIEVARQAQLFIDAKKTELTPAKWER